MNDKIMTVELEFSIRTVRAAHNDIRIQEMDIDCGTHKKAQNHILANAPSMSK